MNPISIPVPNKPKSEALKIAMAACFAKESWMFITRTAWGDQVNFYDGSEYIYLDDGRWERDVKVFPNDPMLSILVEDSESFVVEWARAVISDGRVARIHMRYSKTQLEFRPIGHKLSIRAINQEGDIVEQLAEGSRDETWDGYRADLSLYIRKVLVNGSSLTIGMYPVDFNEGRRVVRR